MKHFYIHHDLVEITLTNGSNLVIYFTPDTGKIFYRYKINTISRVRHPGIFLGVDGRQQLWYMHNHFEHGRPVIEIGQGFAKGQPLYIGEQQPQLGHRVVVQNALNEILQAKQYNWINYNCQVFVNKACFNEIKSETVENWASNLALGLLLLVGTSAFNNSK
jgi:hypothetical protein